MQQMVDTCHSYYAALWGRGQLAAADALLDPAVVHRDLCGAWLVHVGQPGAGVHAAQPATGLTVGPRGVKALVADVRQQYPDMYVQVRGVMYVAPRCCTMHGGAVAGAVAFVACGGVSQPPSGTGGPVPGGAALLLACWCVVVCGAHMTHRYGMH